MRLLIPSVLLAVLPPLLAQEPVLPPEPPSHLTEHPLPPDAPWATPCERSGMTRSPDYAETVAWLKRLVAASPRLAMVEIGTSDEGRSIPMVVASREGAHTPEALRANGRPTLLAQGGIHPGEIDGKDAGMMLLRDLTVGGTDAGLLDGANFLFVPILSVDGHERRGPYGRINQRGPEVTGWRTNGRNQNLNRDYAKLDTPEVRAVVAALGAWAPDLYYDIHVTDGADYQYDITWGYHGAHGHSPAIAAWLASRLDPALRASLAKAGHVPGPLIFLLDESDPSKGNRSPTFSPRFSHGYGDLRHLPTILVENHSLKGSRQRVLGTRVLLRSTLRVLAEDGKGLRGAEERDLARRPERVPLDFGDAETPPRMFAFAGIERVETKWPAGGSYATYTGRAITIETPEIVGSHVLLEVRRPKAYWVPSSWPEVIGRIEAHGIAFERIKAPRTVDVEMSRAVDHEMASAPFEGRMPVTANWKRETRREVFPAGSIRVSTDQPLGDLAIHLLEPEAPDSFFRWGFFLGILQRTEYVETYVMAPTALRMMKEDAALKRAYEERLAADEAFRGDLGAQMQWFYERTKWFDDRFRLYPVGREG